MLMKTGRRLSGVRRSVGFKLDSVAKLLRSYASFAAEHGDRHVVSDTAITWASEGKSEAQRDNRLKTVIRFAQFVRAEDNRHQIPPEGVFWGRRQRPTPYIFSEGEVRQLVTGLPVSVPPGRCDLKRIAHCSRSSP